jgi:hypothetical protein
MLHAMQVLPVNALNALCAVSPQLHKGMAEAQGPSAHAPGAVAIPSQSAPRCVLA